MLVAVFCPRGAPYVVSTFGLEWWDTVASTAAIDCCSCRHHERSRRCLRRHAAPPSRAAINMASRLGSAGGCHTKPGQTRCEQNTLLLLLLLLL